MIHLTPELLAVKVPDGAYGFRVTNPVFNIGAQLSYFDRFFATDIKLPAGTWKRIGTLRQVWENDMLIRICGFTDGESFRLFIREHPEVIEAGFLSMPDQWVLLRLQS